MKNIQIITLLVLTLFTSCSKDPVFEQEPFVVAFKESSGKLLEIENEKHIELIYSETAIEDGVVRIKITTENAEYGRDFVTIPEATENEISLPIAVNETENSFQIIELNNAFTDVMKITFSIIDIETSNANIQGNTTYELNDSAFLGGTFSPTVGGPNEPNQVYIDLSSNKETLVLRDSWDLGFYGGDHFRVAINGSLYMAVAALETTDINSVNATTVASLQSTVAVGTFNPENTDFIDAPNGDILQTAINEVSEDNSQNPVYLVNLGASIGNTIPVLGSVAIAGDLRGWKKIRVLRNGAGYTLQYANLEDITYKEISITKDTDFNFTFFSLNTEQIVNVEPQKTQWDICFTVFTNILDGAGSYGFSDFVIHNRKGGVTGLPITRSYYFL